MKINVLLAALAVVAGGMGRAAETSASDVARICECRPRGGVPNADRKAHV